MAFDLQQEMDQMMAIADENSFEQLYPQSQPKRGVNQVKNNKRKPLQPIRSACEPQYDPERCMRNQVEAAKFAEALIDDIEQNNELKNMGLKALS